MAFNSNERMLITGGTPLLGEVEISGGKNTAVAIIPAALLCDEACTIENVPDIEDVHSLIEILRYVGAKVKYIDANTLYIEPNSVNKTILPDHLSAKLRASYYLLGAMIGKYHHVGISAIGGCQIGGRPIDQHIKGFQSLNINVRQTENELICECDKVIGGDIFFNVASVGATINIMMAAVKGYGNTIIYNPAKEPHVVDVANFLNSMGAKIRGAGTDLIKIKSVPYLHKTTYKIIPDQIETGTMMIAAAATRGLVNIVNCIPVHMESLSAKLLEIGIRVLAYDNCIRIEPIGPHRAVSIGTQVYPGFPTDLQQPMSSLLTRCAGTSILVENIYENRFNHVKYLQMMGADIKILNKKLIINGVNDLYGANVAASDLRAGASLIIAGLMAKGVTEISGTQYIDRGYSHIEKKLVKLGANIKRICRCETP